jgi:hypothetical protein
MVEYNKIGDADQMALTALPPTANELRTLVAHLLAGATGKPEKHWFAVVGEIEALPLIQYIGGNWRAAPQGSEEDLAAVEAALSIVRAEYPYVREGEA